MKITITRSFERTRQIADFVPVKAACEISGDIELEHPTNSNEEELFNKAISALSMGFDQLVQSEVEKTLMGYTPACITCGGKAIFPKKALNKEGICGQCQSEHEMKARELTTNKKKNLPEQ